MKRRAAVVVLAALAAISLSLTPAFATGRHHRGHGKVLVVDNEHRHRSCLGTRKPFRTIQSAVDDEDAVPGATIWVCPGLYKETVKSVVQNPHPDLNGTDATVQLLADDITWDGFTFLGTADAPNGPGMRTDPAHSGYLIRDTIFQDNDVGLRLAANGTQPSFVCRNRFVANNEFDPTGGAILFSDTGAGTHTDVLIDHNKSVRDLTFATIFSSTRLRLSHNDARNRLVGPAGGSSSIYIGARNKDIDVHRNRVRSASGNGIDVTPRARAASSPWPRR